MDLLVVTEHVFTSDAKEANDALAETVWQHQNGHDYHVESVAREEDLCVNMVVHVGLHDGRRWVRTVENFLGDKNGKPRFVRVA